MNLENKYYINNSDLKITLEELKDKGIIYIENIQRGFSKYPNLIIEGSEEYVNNAVKQLVAANGIENSYADFYYGRLDEDEKNKVKEALNEREIVIVESLQLSKDDIFVHLNDELLEILLKLTSKEVLFSTFYFTKYPTLVWGNYGRRYPVFFKDEFVMETVKEQIWV
ncbi:hypothetical protein [Inconstantimicrobium mannanitabidum]|uniref:Uncharacterized protein n=1 Tax=Inconstantimicrobium mannanitabidum TaxID=1604901 RepID=A0ACB5RE64_9CLOT|nr:hypothetical protein [Clostridium sp. TW13]GKX67391.1 hypothetical protein rsdtw13_26490 [Clostridium sp. TW13]